MRGAQGNCWFGSALLAYRLLTLMSWTRCVTGLGPVALGLFLVAASLASLSPGVHAVLPTGLPDGRRAAIEHLRNMYAEPSLDDIATIREERATQTKVFGSLDADHPLNSRPLRAQAVAPQHPTFAPGHPHPTLQGVPHRFRHAQHRLMDAPPAPGGPGHAGSAPGPGHSGSAPGGPGHSGSAPAGPGHSGSAPGGASSPGHTHDVCEADAAIAAQVAALAANETRTVRGLLALYATALYDQCGPYVSALRSGDAAALLSAVVSNNAQGRIHPLGLFGSPTDMIEYFMLACGNVGSSNVLYEDFSNIVVTGNQVWFQVNFWMGQASAPTTYVSNLTHTGWVKVNAAGQVCALKVSFQRLGIGAVPAPALTTVALNQYTAGHSAVHAYLCTAIQELCVGANQQFANVSQCVAWYAQGITNSGMERGDQPDEGCKEIHLDLCAISPQVHCPHVGPSTDPNYDPACTPHTTQSWYETDVVLENIPCDD